MTSFVYQGQHFRCLTGSLPFLLAVLMKAAEQAAEKAKTIEKDLINIVLKENALEVEE